MLKLRSAGVPLTLIVNDLSREYAVTPRAVYKDFKNRKRWLNSFLGLKDPETFFLELISNHQQIRNKVYFEYLQADNK